MACEVYDALHREWEYKFRAEVSAHDGRKGRSEKQYEADTRIATAERVAAEHGENRRVTECAVCISQGRKPHEVDHHGRSTKETLHKFCIHSLID